MIELVELAEPEYQKMGSLNHSIVQARLTGLLFNDERFTLAVELSLDVTQIDLSQFGLRTPARYQYLSRSS